MSVRKLRERCVRGADTWASSVVLCRHVGIKHGKAVSRSCVPWLSAICCAGCLWHAQADVEALALFSLELGSALSDRSLECALASALSVVGHDGRARGGRAVVPYAHTAP